MTKVGAVSTGSARRQSVQARQPLCAGLGVAGTEARARPAEVGEPEPKAAVAVESNG
jgi:hypothetical protein